MQQHALIFAVNIQHPNTNLLSEMSVRKRNEYLDTFGSEEEDTSASDREAAADSRTAGLVSRSSKRQKLTASTSDSEDDSDHGDIEGQVAPIENAASPKAVRIDKETSAKPQEPLPTSPQSKPFTKRKILSSTTTPGPKPGVIYLSRVPPFMRPSTVRTLLSAHGPIIKLFLTPEPPSAYLTRRKHGGNKKHSYIDGWVEFSRKKDAKVCVDAINGQIVGGKKGGWYRDDVWNARYLRGFGWGDLMGQVRQEEREREERVRVGLGREGRERGEFLRNLERAGVDETRKKKREKRKGKEEESGVGREGDGAIGPLAGAKAVEARGEEGKRKGFERRFRQNEVKGKANKQAEQPDEVRRVLSKIF